MKNTYKTRLRQELINILTNQLVPYSFIDINDILISKDLQYNKTSIYRQLEKMLEEELIKVIDTPNGKVWELKTNHEHTHFICEQCNNTLCLDFDTNVLQEIANFNNSIKLKIKNLSLSGLCSKCL